MKNYIVFLVVAAFYSCFCQAQDLGDAEVAGSKYMLGIVRYCTMSHNTNSDQIVKLFKGEADDQNSKCAVMCILQSTQIMDQNGNFREGEIQRLLNKLPDDDKKAEIQATIKECVEDGTSQAQTRCDAAFAFTKCLTKLKGFVPRELIPTL